MKKDPEKIKKLTLADLHKKLTTVNKQIEDLSQLRQTIIGMIKSMKEEL